MKEKKDRVDDALAATKAAIEEGIVPGGGVALVRAGDSLKKLKGDNDDESTGIQIIANSIEEPLKQIVRNAGGEGAVIVSKVRKVKMTLVTMQNKINLKIYLKLVLLTQQK